MARQAPGTPAPVIGPPSRQPAVAHAAPDVPVVAAGQSVADVRRTLVGRRFTCASYLAVCDGRSFRGIVSIEDLLAAPDAATVADIMDADPPTIAPGVDQEVAAWRAVRKGESALPVVDADGNFVGLIPPDRLLAVLLEEHEEDLSRLGGLLKSASAARASSEEPFQRSFWHRIPWLLLGLVGAMIAADLVGAYETVLSRKVMIAFFIPGIVYLADAVGTQTETMIVRGLSIGVPLRRMAAREIATGLAIGVVVGAAAGLLIWLRWGDPPTALSVMLALFAACGTATATAMVLPGAFSALGQDPAFASGPLATVIQDLLSIVIYFAIAMRIVP